MVFDGSGTLQLINMQVVQYPYMTLISGYVSFTSVTANDSVLYLLGFPSVKDAASFYPEPGPGREYVGHLEGSTISPMLVYTSVSTPAQIVTNYHLDYYKAPTSGYITIMTIPLHRSSAAERYFFQVAYGSEAEIIEFKTT